MLYVNIFVKIKLFIHDILFIMKWKGENMKQYSEHF